ncbi:hypothetical protein [Krasilnikovia sp. MM14-A1004]|uniref:hypothetical protein n=1 Tax=Krasilnikovia sp. MM14-A1004 TaxID=3373541 RepID=UPI00399D2B71
MAEQPGGHVRADDDPISPDESQPAAIVPAATDEPVGDVPHRGGCRTSLHGWAGAHLHGAVRPRRRATGRGRPPGRWC